LDKRFFALIMLALGLTLLAQPLQHRRRALAFSATVRASLLALGVLLLGNKTVRNSMAMQMGDVPATRAEACL